MRARLLGLTVLVVLALLASLAMLLWDVRTPQPSAAGDLEPAPAPSELDAGPAPLRPASPRTPSAPTRCTPRAHKACQNGDLWWFDSCGVASEPSERCEGRGCEHDQCAAASRPENHCGAIGAYGICEGEIAKACVADRIVSVDCSEQRARCVMTSEGASCLPRDDKLACSERDAALCLGDRLRQCVDGRWAVIDCALRKAHCVDSAGQAHCESELAPRIGPMPQEICDGHDNDQDGRVDEGGVCEPIPLVAFIPNGAKLANLETRMQDELAILNRVFDPMRFQWAKTMPTASRYRNFDPRELEDAAAVFSQLEAKQFIARTRAADPSAAPSGDDGLDFYVAVLFSEKLRLDPPKSGISTLPNAHCGGVRVSDQPSPPHGLIVLTEARAPTTLSHEMGHYLGLCHTHEELARFAVKASARPECQRSGDGICDTAFDPGPTQCEEQAPCDFVCRRSPARPDAANVMSYYIPCRRELTAEQLAEAEHGLSLRRGWFRCLDPRDCSCDPAQLNGCPADMSCHPGASRDAAWSCELDGPGLPGAACRDASQCSNAAFCLGRNAGDSSGRCTRPCYGGGQAGECTCQDVGLAFPVCGEDLR
jgi:hypothetical protein